ncbi:putative prolyl 4-hydroxylase 9 [Bidens hawaiensis]|uniref:putative prolyl 4-hydroxylase 9 n=1 Tax=Bidens hawaiensis TaxID=980011 RepID=UPI00404A57F7
MKSRGKIGGRGVTGRWSNLGLPGVFILCVFIFFLGFFGSSLLSQQVETEFSLHPRPRVLNEKEYEPLPSGDFGDGFLTTIPFQVLSWTPRALHFPAFATAQQCESIIKMAEVELTPSTLALREGETEEQTKGVRTRYSYIQLDAIYILYIIIFLILCMPIKRTSSGMFISANEDKMGILDLFEKKIERATMIPRNHGEAFNILRYDIGQRYLAHYDTFNPAEYGPQKSQRMASFLLYLSDVEEGGETMFPFENGESKNATYDIKKCSGLKVKPRKGDGLLFYTLHPNGTIDSASLHGGCDVIKGQKWVATKWIRNEREPY